VEEPRGAWQDPSTDIENVNAAYVIERDENARLRAEVERLREALERIRTDEGKVCDTYETCTHRACQSSYAAWAIADAALAGSPSGKETPE
jgi:hypothetical protein